MDGVGLRPEDPSSISLARGDKLLSDKCQKTEDIPETDIRYI